MGSFRGGGPRASRALLAVCAICFATPSGGAFAAAGPGVPAPQAGVAAPATTTTLPALPSVSGVYTDGQPAQKLLDNAISLASLGLDDTALRSAIAVTQAKLDAEAQQAQQERRDADAASAKATAARKAASDARSQYFDMAGAIRQAAIYLYTSGPDPLPISTRAGTLRVYAEDYAESTIGPLGALARSETLKQASERGMATARGDAEVASRAESKAAAALASQQRMIDQLKAELASASAASASALAADRVALTSQAGQELMSQSALEFTPKMAVPAPVSTTPIALTWAFSELGKQYVWGATGPGTFDCSGLTQFVWKAAGVSIPRVAADQDQWAVPVPLSQLLPGDLVFFGTTDIHHVGIYIGDGLMVNAPHTGTVVQVSPIWWSDLAGFGRVHAPGTPAPTHGSPTPSHPAKQAVTATAGPVPSQTKPPAGWKPGPGSSAPVQLGEPYGSSIPTDSPSSTTTTTTLSTGGTSVPDAAGSPSPSPSSTTSVGGAPADAGTTTTTVSGS
jgi:cell wall-associated NlpC family hydrolase